MKLVEITKKELELQLAKLEDEFHYKSLVKIFIENKVYKVLETCESQQEISDKVFEGCNKYRSLLRRDIVRSDIDRLVQLPIRNISHFDSQKNEDELAKILKDIESHASVSMEDLTAGDSKELES